MDEKNVRATKARRLSQYTHRWDSSFLEQGWADTKSSCWSMQGPAFLTVCMQWEVERPDATVGKLGTGYW